MIVITALNHIGKAVDVKFTGSVELTKVGAMLFVESLREITDNGIAHEVKSTDFFYMVDVISIRGI